jgi:hypothetical protein
MTTETYDPKIPPDELVKCAADAEKLAAKIKAQGGSLEPAFDFFTEAIEKLDQSDTPLESLVPAESEVGLGFSGRRARTGKGFWARYKQAIRSRVCDPKSDFHKRLHAGAPYGAGAIIGWLMTALGLPLVGLPVATGITGVILASGIEALCAEDEKPSPPKKKTKTR